MSEIKKLIERLCPDGVEYKTLGEVCVMQRGTSMTKKNAIEGDIPVISGGREPAFYINQSNREGETITVAGSGAGAGYVQYWNEPIFVNDAFSVKGSEELLTKYVYYCMKNMQEQITGTQKGGGVPHVHISSIDNFEIPVPPIEVQSKIVEILDNFTELEIKLEAELEARRKQYEYYRNQLLTFDKVGGARFDVKWMKLGEVADITIGEFVHKNKQNPNGKYPVYNGGSSFTGYYDQYNRTGNKIVISARGAYAGFVNKVYDCYWAGNSSYSIEVVSPEISWHFLYYYLKKMQYYMISKQQKGGGVPAISKKQMQDFEIPIPSLEEQKRIVSILDRFEALTTDLQSGLPAEIEARRKQYEYYREQLLTFKRKTA